ncbi:hypothetical protein SteCoe_31251 [Stentor coeruleus]|uniref:Uncharacterized protein n=1 Tax=Stentor coeruleus TaxID=5963 RepID=A0A1R2B1R1_9CILI|nr:hypothetical protein SteCoe_31251 [Stentor coeruleus]
MEVNNMSYAHLPKTTRAMERPKKQHGFSNPALTPTAAHSYHNRFPSPTHTSEAQRIHKEISQLQKDMIIAHKELESLKAKHEFEINSLKNSFEILRKDIQTLKDEKSENLGALNGFEEDRMLKEEVLRLRMEVDKMAYMYSKEKRKNVSTSIEEEENEEEPESVHYTR